MMQHLQLWGAQTLGCALDRDLKDETEFLGKYDTIVNSINDRFDVRGNDLTTLVLSCLKNNGKISANRRKKFELTVPAAPVFDAIEEAGSDEKSMKRLFDLVLAALAGIMLLVPVLLVAACKQARPPSPPIC